MTKTEWSALTQNQYILLDGATGSNLMKAGMPVGVCPEQWILEHPDSLIRLQKAYVEAGTNILYAPTFTANRIKLQEYGLQEKQETMIRDLVGLSRQAAQGRAYIAGDITMTGRQLAPTGNMQLEELIEVYKEQIICLEKAGVDLLVAETMMSLAEARAALIAAKEVSQLPVMVTMTFEADGRTLFGTDAATAAIVLESLGADAVGVNCSTGPSDMAGIVAEMAKVTRIPLIAKPNAGMPVSLADGSTGYNMSAEVFADQMRLLIDAGATLLGGCCGTSPEYIAALRTVVEEAAAQQVLREVSEERSSCDARKDCESDRRSTGMRYLTSERQTLSFGLDDKLILVGERINPTGKKTLQAQLREGCLDMVLDFAQEQENSGAEVLDVNLGMSGIDEKQMMLTVIQELQTVTNLPLSLDSSHVDVLEAALRHYPGRALVNSVSMESEKLETLLPIVKKYGAMFILLPLSDQGLPKTPEEKIQIIDTVCERAYALGMKKEDIVVDGLVTTVGANKSAAIETLETIRYCKEKGLATICGLSNISFGMPARAYVNSTFLTLAIQAGLTMAIANPNQELMRASALAADLLLNKEGADLKYIECAAQFTAINNEKSKSSAKAVVLSQGGDILKRECNTDAKDSSRTVEKKDHLTGIKEAVLKGNRKGIAALVEAALQAGEAPEELLHKALLPGIQLVGDYFDRKRYFLPQLIAGAEAMETAVKVLEPLLVQTDRQEKLPTVVIATVEGDIHDIGKNLVALMLRNHGFQVIDLGKDVPASVIVESAKKHDAQIIGLSALMTTTMQRMREVVQLTKEWGLNSKIVIGGAVITQEYAEEIGAHAYAKDAADTVRVVKKLLEV